MIVKGVTDEDFVNYKVPSMYVATATCSFKCDMECGRQVCQNSRLANSPSISIDAAELAQRYVSNPITHAVVFGGLEPMDQLDEVVEFLRALRSGDGYGHNDDVVIYTGYTKKELEESGQLDMLRPFNNIVVKYGRYVPDQAPHFDHVLGVCLASDNQYAERIVL